MKQNPDTERLLDDILAETAPADFRAGSLDLTLKEVRRRNRARQWNRGILAAALVATAGVVAWHGRGPAMVAQKPPPELLSVIESTSLNPAMVVKSVPGSVVVIESKPGTNDLRLLNDDQLLAMTEGSPAILVRHGPHEAELLLVNSSYEVFSPADRLDH